jgi:phenylacetate-CoA ligase
VRRSSSACFASSGCRGSGARACTPSGGIQPSIEHLGRGRAFLAYRKARRDCPAYRAFLEEHGAPSLEGPDDFARLPITTKENYVKRYSIEARCHGGRIPRTGVVIDESSGSSGVPNNWVRGADERASTRRLLRHAYRLRFGDRPLVFLNCFALGPWATGMNVSMSIVDIAILKSIGPDKAKLENTLELFGPGYGYVLAGYPPFIKDWLDTTGLDLSAYDLHLITGGEGCSEGLRAFFEETFRTVVSSYGASDLEINIAAETELAIALRKACAADRELCRTLFGRELLPMIFQYNPFDYHVESTDEGELVFTVLRRSSVAPKIRYNIRDLGGGLTYRYVAEVLAKRGMSIESLADVRPALPFLYVIGRSDLSVPFYGAKVFTTDMEAILHDTPEIAGRFSSFQLHAEEGEDLEKRLAIRLERAPGSDSDRAHGTHADPAPGSQSGPAAGEPALASLLYERLKDVNQDFREVSKLFGPEAIEVEVHDNGTGPFATRDRRVKERYVT